MKPTIPSRGRGDASQLPNERMAPGHGRDGVTEAACLSPDVAAILRRARGIGECSWRVGIALGVDPAALEQIERGLDRLFLPTPR